MTIIFPTSVAAKATISIWKAQLICSLKLLERAKSRLWLNISVERRERIDWRNGWPFRDEPPRGRTVLRAFYEVSSLTSHRTRARAPINPCQSAWECSSYVTVTLTLWVQVLFCSNKCAMYAFSLYWTRLLSHECTKAVFWSSRTRLALHNSRIAQISILKSHLCTLASSNRKCSQLVLGFHYQSTSL